MIPLARLLLILILPLSLAGACERLFLPLGEQEAALTRASETAKPSLLRVATCWAGLPLMQDIAAALQAERPSLSIEIAAATSAAAAEMLVAGAVDLALLADARGASPAGDVIALDALCLIVAAEAPLQEISLQELAALYGGYRLDWAELGAGRGAPQVITYGAETAPAQLFRRAVMGKDEITTAALVMPHDSAVVEYVVAHREAIGYVSRAYVDERVRPLRLGDHSPTATAIRQGRYPLSYRLILQLAPDASQEAAQMRAFLSTPQGRKLIEKRYVLP